MTEPLYWIFPLPRWMSLPNAVARGLIGDDLLDDD